MKLPRLGVRSRLLVAIVAAVAFALALALVAFSFLLDQRLSASATSLAKGRAQAELSSLQIRNGELVAPEGPDDVPVASQVWVFSGSRVLEAPSVSAEVDRAARSLAGGPDRSLDIREQTRLYALPIVEKGVRYGTVVSAISLDPYEETSRTALIGSIALAVLVLAAVTMLARLMLGRALLPVSRMTEDAAAWSEHDLDHRFNRGEPYDELTRLAATLDRLLERIAASLRHEQRFTAEVSHELRTPLARISGEAELMLRRERTPDEYREALAAIQRSADQMTHTVETLVAAARQEAGLAGATSDARDAVGAAASNVRETAREMDVRVTLPAEPVRVAVDEELAARMIQPLLDNAVRYGQSTVEVSLTRNGSSASIRVADDGPGVAEHERTSIFEPGTRGEAAGSRVDGAGLGLALAQRLVQSAGGEITAVASSSGGDFVITLPLAG
ncbi:MAG: two-component system, OmpR family, sensor kinase [Gaiellaceae bacterium]|jgi:signal transduction histidine kinase|nr:two-component system, OmpR family, sensor kinase [Gaiellaceae bacterium]